MNPALRGPIQPSCLKPLRPPAINTTLPVINTPTTRLPAINIPTTTLPPPALPPLHTLTTTILVPTSSNADMAGGSLLGMFVISLMTVEMGQTRWSVDHANHHNPLVPMADASHWNFGVTEMMIA